MEKFWLVWRDTGSPPSKKHATVVTAKDEAERLARQHGGVFYVVEVVAACEKADIVWHEYPAQ